MLWKLIRMLNLWTEMEIELVSYAKLQVLKSTESTVKCSSPSTNLKYERSQDNHESFQRTLIDQLFVTSTNLKVLQSFIRNGKEIWSKLF